MFTIEDKTVFPNPFYEEDENQVDSEQGKPTIPSLEEQIAKWEKMKRKKKT